MKRFHCQCGAQLFFENQHCLKCGLDVGFDSELMTMVPVDAPTRAEIARVGGIPVSSMVALIKSRTSCCLGVSGRINSLLINTVTVSISSIN